MPDFGVHFRSGGHGTLAATAELVNRTHLKYGRGISRIGLCTFEVYGLAGVANPAGDDYLEVRYDGTHRWSGIIREAVQDQHDKDHWTITATDPLGIISRRKVDVRASYASTNERTVVLDILSRIGITSATAPIRFTTNSILAGGTGNSIASHRVEYDNPLMALQQLAIAFNRELGWKRENIAGTDYWVIYYVDKMTGPNGNEHTIAQNTIGGQTGQVEDVTDNWDKAAKVSVLGEGDGSEAPVGTAGAGGTTDPKGVVPLRAINDATVAGSAATTLNSAFGSDRRVLVCNLEAAEPAAEASADVGYRLAVQDENAAALGDFRVLYLEVDEDYTDGWFSRVTLISPSVPALPSVTRPGAVRPPGLADLGMVSDQHRHYKQRSDFAGATTTTPTEVQSTFSATLTGETIVSGGQSARNYAVTTPNTHATKHAYLIRLQIRPNAHIDGPVTVTILLVGPGGNNDGSVVFQHTFSFMQANKIYKADGTWVHKVNTSLSGSQQVDNIRVIIDNLADQSLVVDGADSNVQIFPRSEHSIDLSHRHNV